MVSHRRYYILIGIPAVIEARSACHRELTVTCLPRTSPPNDAFVEVLSHNIMARTHGIDGIQILGGAK